MGLIQRALGAMGYERRAYNPNDTWASFQALRNTSSDPEGISAVYACVSAISETVASLPLILFKRDGEDRTRANEHPLYRVLHDQANEHQTALEFRELMQANVLLRGNAYARIEFDGSGQVSALWPINPDRVSVIRNGDRLAYEYTDSDGKLIRLLSHEVLHLRHRLGPDGVLGVSPIQAARGVIDLAQAEQDHGAGTFANGTRLSGVLKFPGLLKPEQRIAIRDSWASQHAGGSNAGKTAILESGVEFQQVSMTLEDAEWIAARQFSVEEVARLFRVPPTVIGDLMHGNFSNSLEMGRQFITLSLRRHLVAWEQAIQSKLLTEAGRRIYFAEHQVEGLLRGDSATRASFYSSGIRDGWMLRSEARKLENLPAVQGIDNQPAPAPAPAALGDYPSKRYAHAARKPTNHEDAQATPD